MEENRREPESCIAVDFRNRLLLENNCHDPISTMKELYGDKIAHELMDRKSMTIAYSFTDGSIIIFQKNQTGIVDSKTVFQAYMSILLNPDSLSGKKQPNMDLIKKEVSQKLKDLKRRTRGNNS